MGVDRDRFMEEGFLILRDVVPPDKLEETRASYEALLDKQKVVWARERKPGDPPGGVWETAAQPRLNLYQTDLLDRSTAGVVDVWLSDNTIDVSRQLLCLPEASVAGMMMMSNGVRDAGPADWHRDIHPVDMGPLDVLVSEVRQNGPRYVQWNIPLYDDGVLWVVPGSHLRLNSAQEDRELRLDAKVPLTGGVRVELGAGDGVVYSNFLIHWGSDYTTKRRRTIHGGHSIFPFYEDLSFTQYLSPSARESFELWDRRSATLQDHTEAALQAAIRRDGAAYRSALEDVQPGAGEIGQVAMTILLSKAVLIINMLRRPEFEVPEELRRRGSGYHPITLNWGPLFADRFSTGEAETLWDRFKGLDAQLRADEVAYHPGFQGGPVPYEFNAMPEGLSVDRFIESWGC